MNSKMLFEVVMTEFDWIELVLWIASIVVMAITGALFYKDKKVNPNAIYISIFWYFFIAGRICRLIVKFYIGQPDVTVEPTGIIKSFYVGYTIFTYLGLFFIYFAIERMILKKSRYFFSILTIGVTILSIINYYPYNSVFLILMPLYIIVLFGMPAIFIFMAAKSSGSVRKHSLIITVGILLFEFGIAFDIPEARELWAFIPPLILQFLSPSLQIIGAIGIRIGFPRDIRKG